MTNREPVGLDCVTNIEYVMQLSLCFHGNGFVFTNDYYEDIQLNEDTLR